MCGHGTIGTVTMAIENGLVTPKEPGVLRLDTPAGLVVATYKQEGRFVEEVRLTNVASFLYEEGLTAEVEGAGRGQGGRRLWRQFLRHRRPQACFRDIADYTAGELVGYSPKTAQGAEREIQIRPPGKPGDQRPAHILWAGEPKHPEATARNAVFYGEKAIDRSPCAPAPRRAWRNGPPRQAEGR